MSVGRSVAAALLGCVLIGCTGAQPPPAETATDDLATATAPPLGELPSVGPAPSPTVPESPTPQPTAMVSPTPTITPTPGVTATPTPSPTPTPTSTPTPSPTPVDTTPVVVPGEGWTITEADVERLHRFVERVHELDFRAPVRVEHDDDIGAGFARDIDLLPEPDWRFFAALGLVDLEDREAIAQVRRDRIRGVCCGGEGIDLSVIVEPRATKLETEVILVHELVHALHRQHPGLFGDEGPSGGFELPDTYAAVIEGIPQLVAFRYLEEAPAAERAVVEPELVIIGPDRLPAVGAVPAAMLNYGYFVAPVMVEAVYEARGAAGLSELLAGPPTTTEQIIFPERWLAGEDRVSQAAPPLPDAAVFVDEGRLGVTVLEWLLTDPVDPDPQVRELLASWTGDRWSLYRLGGRDCIAAVVEMDSVESAAVLLDRLPDRLGARTPPDVGERRIGFDTCAA